MNKEHRRYYKRNHKKGIVNSPVNTDWENPHIAIWFILAILVFQAFLSAKFDLTHSDAIRSNQIRLGQVESVVIEDVIGEVE